MTKFRQGPWFSYFVSSLLVMALALPFLLRPERKQKSETKEGFSGAMEALNLWATERAYPNRVIPDVAQAAAYEEMQFSKVQAAASEDPIDHLVSPWASI